MEFKLLVSPTEISFNSGFEKANKLRRDKGRYFLELNPEDPQDRKQWEALYLEKNAISTYGVNPKDLAAFDQGFNEPDAKKALEELRELRMRLPALIEDADTKAAEAEIMRVALEENAELETVPAMLAERRKKQEQAEEASILRDTAVRRIEKLESKLKDALRARRKRVAEEGKARLHAAAEALNQGIAKAYAEFWKAAPDLFRTVSENERGFPPGIEYRSPAMNIADGAAIKSFTSHPLIKILPSGHLWFDLKQAVRGESK